MNTADGSVWQWNSQNSTNKFTQTLRPPSLDLSRGRYVVYTHADENIRVLFIIIRVQNGLSTSYGGHVFPFVCVFRDRTNKTETYIVVIVAGRSEIITFYKYKYSAAAAF